MKLLCTLELVCGDRYAADRRSFVCLSVLEYCLSGCLLFRKKTLAEF